MRPKNPSPLQRLLQFYIVPKRTIVIAPIEQSVARSKAWSSEHLGLALDLICQSLTVIGSSTEASGEPRELLRDKTPLSQVRFKAT